MNNENNVNKQFSNGQMANNSMGSTTPNMNNNMMRNPNPTSNMNNRMNPSSNMNHMEERSSYLENPIPTSRMATSKSINAPIQNGVMPNTNMNRNPYSANINNQNNGNGQNIENRMQQNPQDNRMNQNIRNVAVPNIDVNQQNNGRIVDNSMYSQNNSKQEYQASPLASNEMPNRPTSEMIPTSRPIGEQNYNARVNAMENNKPNIAIPEERMENNTIVKPTSPVEENSYETPTMSNEMENQTNSNSMEEVPYNNYNDNLSENNTNGSDYHDINMENETGQVENIDSPINIETNNNMENIPLSDERVSDYSINENNFSENVPLSDDMVANNTTEEIIENTENNIEEPIQQNNIDENFQPQIGVITDNNNISDNTNGENNGIPEMSISQEPLIEENNSTIETGENPTITEVSTTSQNEEPQIVEQLPASSMGQAAETATETEKKEEAKDTKAPKEKKKKSKLGLIIFLMLIIMIITAGIVIAMKYYLKTPYETTISKVFSMAKSNYDPSKSYRLSGLITLDTTDESLKILNNYSIDYVTAIDSKNNNNLLKVNINENNLPLIDLATYLTADKLYIKSDKVLQGVYYISDMVNSEILNTNDEKYMMDVTEKALKAAFKDEKANTENVTLTINGKSVSAKNSYYTINNDSMKRIVKNIVEVYENDTKAIQIMAKVSNEVTEADIKEALKQIKEEEYYSDDSYKLGFYTQGILNDVIGFSISQNNIKFLEYVSSDEYSLLTINGASSLSQGLVAETKKGVCNIKVVQDQEEQLIATITKINDKEYVADIYLSDNTTLKLESKIEENGTMEAFDTSTARDIQTMTDEEMQLASERITTILQNSAIYPYIEGLLSTNTYKYEMDNYSFDDSLLDIETPDWSTMQPQVSDGTVAPIQ